MPVNKSDMDFFEKARMIMNAALSASSTPPTIDDLRAVVKHFKPFVSQEPLLPYQKLTIPSINGHTLSARLISRCDEKRPLFIFFPGTGFMHELFDENYTIISRIIKNSECHGVMLEHRLSPEFPFPCPHEDATAALCYLLENINGLNIDKERVIIGGFSSGANMAAVLCNALQHHQDFRPFHQYLFSGGFDYTDSLHEFDDFVNADKMLDKEAQKLSFDMFCQKADRKDPRCSPYFQADFSNLCPTTIQCGEYDGGRSQSEGYTKKLRDNHVDVEKIIVPGQTHFTILYREACSDGEDPAIIAAQKINNILS